MKKVLMVAACLIFVSAWLWLIGIALFGESEGPHPRQVERVRGYAK